MEGTLFSDDGTTPRSFSQSVSGYNEDLSSFTLAFSHFLPSSREQKVGKCKALNFCINSTFSYQLLLLIFFHYPQHSLILVN